MDITHSVTIQSSSPQGAIAITAEKTSERPGIFAMVKVSVIIKTFNEEENIERAIRSALGAVAPFGGEVVVADSASTDRTIERAMKFPVVIVQLGRPDERCCGIGPQLGYLHSKGEYIYVLDGDMELDAEFIAHAVEFLEREPSVAGVGGYVREMRVENLEFEARVKRQHRQLGERMPDVDALTGGGLYRRAAIEEVGYLSDRNLHGYEEYDLGARLRAKGWHLVRFDIHAADHYSYSMTTYGLLLHRIRAGYIFSSGELVRAAIENCYLGKVYLELNGIRIATAVWVYWIVIASILPWIPNGSRPIAVLTSLLLPALAMALRTRSLRLGFHSVLLWHVNAAGLMVGLLRKRKSPSGRIESRVFVGAQ